MNAITDQPAGWWIVLVVIWTVAIMFIVLAAAVFVPPLWRAGSAWMRALLPTRRATVIDLNERRRR